MKYKVVFVSKTGNTKKVAMAIYDGITSQSKDIVDLEGGGSRGVEADIYFVGFWVNRGSASWDILEYLGELEGKRIALFGTCGFGEDQKYKQKIEQQVKVWIPDSAQYLGLFLCQGKMGVSVRKKYEQMMKNPEMEELAKQMIYNYDEALLHPDQEDLNQAYKFAKEISEQFQ